MASSGDLDHLVRLRAFEFLERLCQIHGETVPRKKLEEGFEFGGKRVPLIGPQGIWKPAEVGEPVVPNGLALCNLHHAAFDRNVLGVRPDLVVVIRPDVLREVDGPMLIHGLQGFQESRLHVPSSRQLQPDADRLAERYEQFRAAS